MNIDLQLPSILHTIADDIAHKGGQAVVVGGSIRDYFLQLPSKDWDIEVYGLESIDALQKILSHYGKVNFVGKSFGVLKFNYADDEYDFSFPRKEKKTGLGHQGFEVSVDGRLSYQEASSRRDFSINSMGYDISSQTLLDPHNGYRDLQDKVIRHIDATAFKEDPLRVYRAMQFAGRFEFSLHPDTISLCQEMVKNGELDELSIERIYSEFNKLLLKSKKPSIGFEVMRDLGMLRYFPELEALIGIPQSPKYHPEGDVWIHTMMSLDAMVTLIDQKSNEALKFLYAILCHDLGKATTTTIEEGKIRSIGHEYAGVEISKTFMYRLTNNHSFIDSLLPLVKHHLKPSQFFAGSAKSSAIRRLATQVNIQELIMVAKADFLGRTTEESIKGTYLAGEWLAEKSKMLNVSTKPLTNLIQGRDLITLGLEPSPKFKEILEHIYTLQLEEKITNKEEALKYIKEQYTL